jgi:hypothetical protein
VLASVSGGRESPCTAFDLCIKPPGAESVVGVEADAEQTIRDLIARQQHIRQHPAELLEPGPHRAGNS